jgi:hypothetical protein
MLTLVASACIAVPSASAAFGLVEPTVTFTGPDGLPETQAGVHPFALNVSFGINTVEESGKIFPDESTKDVISVLPPGFAANPTATPRCSGSEFAAINRSTGLPACSNASAVGVVAVDVGVSNGAKPVQYNAPVYNLEPAPGTALKLGFVIFNIPVTVEGRLSEVSPYNAIGAATNVAQTANFFGTRLTLWGNPADPAHNPFRGNCADAVKTGPLSSKGKCPVDIPKKPFLTLPTSCTGSVESIFEGDSWQHPGPPYSYREVLRSPPGNSGCGKLGFDPQIVSTPNNHSANGATGLNFELNVADEGLTSATGTAKSAIRDAEVTLPQGVTINPSQAEGLGVCTPADVARETASSQPGQGCPESSKIGSIEVETPLLEGEILKGSLFVAKPFDNPFNTMVAFYMVFRDPQLGIALKLPAKVTPDLRTGQLVTELENLPQLPFSHFRLHFQEGGRSPLVTPPTCGTYTTQARFVPWSNPAASYETNSTFQVTSGVNGGSCPSGATPFKPGFEAGTSNNAASQYSPFYIRLTRSDAEQELTRFSSILPPGVVGKIAGIPSCPQASIDAAKGKTGTQELASPSCPAASQIGRTIGGAGVGSELTYVPGSLYLGGPYNGAPLSVVAITPAIAGPFDVGNVVIQEALDLNPTTAEVEVDGSRSDPIPHILAGVPLRLRDLRVFVDKQNFTLNATSCEPEVTRGTLLGSGSDPFNLADDSVAALTARYQAAGCSSLGFKPKLALKLSGGTRRAKHPALHSTVTYPYPSGPGYANIGRADVTLPPSLFIDNAHVNNPCTRVQFNAEQCPPGSVLGKARAVSPLLDKPLEGPVYFRSNGGERKLPDVVADLRGQFEVILVGFVHSVTPTTNPRIRTRFVQVPDAPVTKFTLDLFGGKRGLLVNNSNLCKKAQRAEIDLTGQNGASYDTKPVVKTSCGSKKKAKGGSKQHRK